MVTTSKKGLKYQDNGRLLESDKFAEKLQILMRANSRTQKSTVIVISAIRMMCFYPTVEVKMVSVCVTNTVRGQGQLQ
jgi:hypothetical protein